MYSDQITMFSEEFFELVRLNLRQQIGPTSYERLAREGYAKTYYLLSESLISKQTLTTQGQMLLISFKTLAVEQIEYAGMETDSAGSLSRWVGLLAIIESRTDPNQNEYTEYLKYLGLVNGNKQLTLTTRGKKMLRHLLETKALDLLLMASLQHKAISSDWWLKYLVEKIPKDQWSILLPELTKISNSVYEPIVAALKEARQKLRTEL